MLVKMFWEILENCPIYGYAFPVICEKAQCIKDFTRNSRGIFKWKDL